MKKTYPRDEKHFPALIINAIFHAYAWLKMMGFETEQLKAFWQYLADTEE